MDEIVPVRDLLEFAIGGGWGTEEPAPHSIKVCVIRGADFPEATVGDLSSAPRRFEKKTKAEKRTLRAGDLILEVSGGTNDRSTGRSVYVSERLISDSSLPIIPASFCRLIRPRSSLVEPRYLYYWLQEMHASGRAWGYQVRSTGIANFQFEHFLDTEQVSIPPLPEQRAIAEVLGALDDKIESNRRLARSSRELLHLLVAERPSETWPTMAITDVAQFVNGGAFTKGASGQGRIVIRIAELNRGVGSSTIYSDLAVDEKHVANAGDLLMAWSGSLGVHIWTGPEAIINQHIFKVIPQGVPPWLIYDRLVHLMPRFRQIAADKATTMGHIQRKHLQDALVPVPTSDVLESIDGLLGPLWGRALTAELESQSLIALRDAILPELLSGRIRVPGVSKLVEGAS